MEQREETAAGRREEGRRRGGRLGGEDERQDTKESLSIREDQRLSEKGENRERVEGRLDSVRGRTENKGRGGAGAHKNIIYT